MPKYEYKIYGPRTDDHGQFEAYDSKDAIHTARRLAMPGTTLEVSKIEFSGHRTKLFEHSYAPRKSYKKTYKK